MLPLTLLIMVISVGTAFVSASHHPNLSRYFHGEKDNKDIYGVRKPFFGVKEDTQLMDIPKVNQPVNEPYSVPFSYAPVNHWYGGDSSTYEMTKDKFALAADRTCKDQSGICKGPCKDDYVALNGVCYKYIHLQLCFADAEQYCKQNAPGGHLASIHCRLNHMFVTNVIEVSYITFPYTWLGGSDCNKEGIFVWTDGSPMDHTAWCPSEPFNANGKESCVALNHKSHFLWSSEDCNKQFNFVCAYKLACPSPDCSAC